MFNLPDNKLVCHELVYHMLVLQERHRCQKRLQAFLRFYKHGTSFLNCLKHFYIFVSKKKLLDPRLCFNAKVEAAQRGSVK